MTQYSAAERQALAKRGLAEKDGSYPIANAQDLHNAIQAIGRSKNPAATKAHIIRRARAMQMKSAIPLAWL